MAEPEPRYRFFTCPLCIIIRKSVELPAILRPAANCKHEKKEFVSYVKSCHAVCLKCVDQRTCIYCGNVARKGNEYIPALKQRLNNLKEDAAFSGNSLLSSVNVEELFQQHIDTLTNISTDEVVRQYTMKIM